MFSGFIEQLEKNKIQSINKKLMIKPEYVDKINYIYFNLNSIIKFLSQKSDLLPSSIYFKLKGLPNEILFLAIVKSGSNMVKERIINFLKNYKKECIYISGKDLKKLNIKPGPIYSKILNKLLSAQLDGKVKNKNDEIKLVPNILKERNMK